jgi:hypothetical protein
MNRRVLYVVLALVVVVAVGFLALIWMDMRHSATGPGRGAPDGNHGPVVVAPGPSKPPQQPQPTGAVNAACGALGVSCASAYFGEWSWPADGSCHAIERNGFPEPDPRCTPGGSVPGLTAETLRSPDWRTKCIRNCQSSEKQKHVTYAWYSLPAPTNNSGATQVCELDHLVPLELGGADGLGNIWPQCGPEDVVLRARYFKQKDLVENYLAREVRAGRMDLDRAQRGIAADWTQYLQAAVQ